MTRAPTTAEIEACMGEAVAILGFVSLSYEMLGTGNRHVCTNIARALATRDATITDLRAQVAEAEAKGRREMRDAVLADLAIGVRLAAEQGEDVVALIIRGVSTMLAALPDTAPEVPHAER